MAADMPEQHVKRKVYRPPAWQCEDVLVRHMLVMPEGWLLSRYTGPFRL
jgi:hypothetical protein